MTMPIPLPYGIRDIKLTPYTDTAGTTLAATSVDLPYGRTLSFSEAEEFTTLRGDDKVIATHGQGPLIEWELESGGISLDALKVIAGGTVTESGTTPNRKTQMDKRGTDQRPYFKVEGQAISDSGGDVHCVIYRCKVTENIEGSFTDGEFFLTAGSGQGLPQLGSDDLLYSFIQNESVTAIA